MIDTFVCDLLLVILLIVTILFDALFVILFFDVFLFRVETGYVHISSVLDYWATGRHRDEDCNRVLSKTQLFHQCRHRQFPVGTDIRERHRRGYDSSHSLLVAWDFILYPKLTFLVRQHKHFCTFNLGKIYFYVSY